MLNVRREICAGCGTCIRACPTDAISLDRGKARIDQAKCNYCYHCIQACPRGAIVGVEAGSEQPAVPSIQELRNKIMFLQAKTQRAAQRLKNLEQRRKIHRVRN